MRSIAPHCGSAIHQSIQPVEVPSLNHGNPTPPAIDADAIEQASSRCAAHEHPPLPGSLGKNTKSSDTPAAKGRKKAPAKRGTRYKVLHQARHLVYRRGTMKKMPYPANLHRVAKCHRQRISKGGYVDMLYSPAHETAHYGGLIQCGSPWACPVCAAKLAERRREEIAMGFDYAYASGGKMIMVTLTFPHTAFDDVKTLLKRQAAALKKLRETRVWKNLREDTGFQYLIRSLEITHGINGWHPHTHEAWWVDKDADADDIRDRVSKYWAAACRKVGLLKPKSEADFARRAVHIVDNATSSAYLQKQDQEHNWGADRELAAGTSKVSKGRHPFRLLEDSADGDVEAGELYLDYIMATKGKAQIFWSRGFKDAAGVNDKSDEELVEEQEEDAVRVVSISPIQWQKVIDEEAQAELLTLVEEQGFIGVARWFRDREMAEPDRPRSAPPESPP